MTKDDTSHGPTDDNTPRFVIPDTPAPALARGAAILDFIAKSAQPVSAQHISDALGLPKSSVHNLCSTLTMLDMLTRRSDQTYVVGPHIMLWARAFTQRADVTAEFSQVLDDMPPLPPAAVTLMLPEGSDVMVIAARNASAVPRAGLRIGTRLPVAFSAAGKAFLSHLSDREVEDSFETGLPPARTRQSVQSTDRLIAQLRRCRVQGYALSDQEALEGHTSIATTVLDHNNQPIAAASLTFASTHPEFENRQSAVERVKQIAEQISLRLGADFGQ